ncbi:MAG TPA: DUF4384 domain-containing protein [Stellaceae bacterium]|jgi:hypothetical protein|nr:DUF4384 domain-containing protein [Stellaceae bacterium]
MALAGRLLVAGIVAAGTAACTVAHRTDVFRQDELTDAQQAIGDAKLGAGDLTVEGSVDRPDTTYAPGQPITLSVKTNKDASVAILRVLASGETVLVFPNRAHRDAGVKANTVLMVPAQGEAVKIAVDQPGTVLFKFIASTAGNAWIFKRAPDEGSDFANLGVTTRNIAKDLTSTFKPGSGAAAASQVSVRITGGGLL